MLKPIKSPSAEQNVGQLLLHLGANKTGSTALQNMLYRNQNLLRQFGIQYTDNNVKNLTVQSGNGQELVDLIRWSGSKNEIKQALLDFLRPDALSIISTEMFIRLSKSQWNSLLECIAELEIRVKALVYIRSPLDFYVSSYNQAVKRQGFYSDLDTFVQKSDWSHLRLLRNLSGLDQYINVDVVLYDLVKDNLFQSFWEYVYRMFAIDVRDLIPEDQYFSNRSLYEEEIHLLQKINQVFNSDYSKLVSNFLVDDSSFKGTKAVLTRRDADKIFHKHEADVSWINDMFFAGESVLTIDNEKYPPDDSESIPSDGYPDPATLVKLVLYLLRHPQGPERRNALKGAEETVLRLENIRYEEQMSDGVWFDSLYYLLKNPDVMSSESSPLKHFNEWGRAENRVWRSRDMSHVTFLNSSQKVQE